MKKELEKARKEFLNVKVIGYYEKSTDIKSMIHFLKTYCKMPYSNRWFFSNPSRLRAIYEEEYNQYFKAYVKNIQKRAQLEETYLRLEKKYKEERINIEEMNKIYKLNGGGRR